MWSVHLSVTLFIVAKWYVLQQRIGSALLRTHFTAVIPYTYPIPSNSLAPKFVNLKFPRCACWSRLFQTLLCNDRLSLSEPHMCLLSDFRLLVLRTRYGEYWVNVISAPVSESHCGSLLLHYCFQCVLLYTCFLHILHVLLRRLHSITRYIVS